MSRTRSVLTTLAVAVVAAIPLMAGVGLGAVNEQAAGPIPAQSESEQSVPAGVGMGTTLRDFLELQK